jgi:hypothetical protein
MAGAFWKLAAICAAAALLAAVSAEQADAQSAMAATAAHCNHHQVATSDRSLSSAESTKLHSFCAKAFKLSATVKLIKSHRLWIAPRYKYWWHVPDRKWAQTVRIKRAKVRRILHKDLPWLDAQIEELSPTLILGDVAAWSCIHSGWKGNVRVGSGEGSWTANTGKYFGGLQMDMEFMSTYGPPVLGYPSAAAMFAARGTADHWTPEEQMAVAEYARSHGRGYYPWPNTAHDCGLI